MSWIGPRPLLEEYLPLYSQEQAKRHNCSPGILGLAQVKGGNNLAWRHRLRYDSFYANHLSFSLDLMIIWVFLRGFAVRKDREVFNEVFKGNDPTK